MIKRLFWLLQILTFAFPVIIFITYILMDEGDQFTSGHYFLTGLSAIPFFIVQLLKFIFAGADEESK